MSSVSGEFLKLVRNEYSLKINKRISQQEMSKLLGISHIYVSQLEQGIRKPSDRVRILYHKVTGISLGVIFINTLQEDDLELLDDHRRYNLV
jgi:transcriptional regulator with XRE-family HTH domain